MKYWPEEGHMSNWFLFAFASLLLYEHVWTCVYECACELDVLPPRACLSEDNFGCGNGSGSLLFLSCGLQGGTQVGRLLKEVLLPAEPSSGLVQLLPQGATVLATELDTGDMTEEKIGYCSSITRNGFQQRMSTTTIIHEI